MSSQSNGNHAGPSSHRPGNGITELVAASVVYEVQAETRNFVAVKGLPSFRHDDNTAATVAYAPYLLDAPPPTPPLTIRVTIAPSPETRRRIESEASRLCEVGESSVGPTWLRLKNITKSILDDVYDMYTTERGCLGRMARAIVGDLVDTNRI